MTCFELMDAQYADTTVEIMARNLPVSKAGYYAWRKRRRGSAPGPARQVRDDRQVKILTILRDSDGTYGSPRITADLRASGERVSANTVAAIMADLGIAGISPRTFKVRTTIVDPSASFPPDLVDRHFDQGVTDAVWTSDITYLTCGEGDLYLCAVKDEHSKRILGWRVADHMRAELVGDCINAAVATRGHRCDGTILHSDRGSQYTSGLVAGIAAAHGLRRSMGATGICWDNAGAESLWSTFKHEYYYRHVFTTKADLVAAVGRWIQRYNTTRRHSSIGQISPTQFEVTSTAVSQAA